MSAMMGFLSLRKLFFFTIIVVLSSKHVSFSSLSSSSHVRQKDDVYLDDDGRRNIRKLGGEKDSRGLERCLQDKILAERVEIGTKCVCKDKTGAGVSADDKGFVLLCSDECAFCNEERTVCGLKSEEALYDVESGSKIGIGQVFEYLKFGPMIDSLSNQEIQDGEGVILGIEELDCKERDMGNRYVMENCAKCNVYFAGTKCNSCEVTECGDNGSGIFAPVMDCTNVQENSIFDFCADISMEKDSVFQAFHPDQFEKCLPMKNLILEE